MIQHEHLTPGRCNFAFGRTIRKALKAAPVALPSALLPSVLHKSRHAPLVICSQRSLLAHAWIYRYGRKAEVFDYSSHGGTRVTAKAPRWKAAC